MSKFPRIIFIGIMLMLFCIVGAAQNTETNTTATQKDVPQLKPSEEKRYKLNPGDVISISFRYTPEYNQTVTIQPDGFVTLEMVGEVKVGGLTLEEARKVILENAAKRLRDPEITLVLKEFQKPYFVVAGEVVQPGRFEMTENITALQALLLAGGFKDSAKSSQIMVYRKINSQTAEVKLLNLKNIKKTSDLENDIELQSGDMIFVPRNFITKFERFVRLSSFAGIFTPFLF